MFGTRPGIVVLAALPLLAGCVQLTQDIDLHKDGSADCQMHYAVNQKSMEQMAALGKTGPGGPGAPGAMPPEMMAMLQGMGAGGSGGGLPFNMGALLKGSGGTTPGAGATTTHAAPQKSPRDEVEEMKKAAHQDADLKPAKEDFKKDLEDMKKAARAEAEFKVEKPTAELPETPAKPAAPLGEDEIRKELAAGTAGVEIKDVKTEIRGDWQHTNITARCRDTKALASFAGSSGGFSLRKREDGNYALKLGLGGLGGLGELGGAGGRGGPFKNMMTGLKIKVRLTVPGKIVESNAHEKSGRTVSWSLDAADADFSKKIEDLDSGLLVVFSGRGLDLGEAGER